MRAPGGEPVSAAKLAGLALGGPFAIMPEKR